MCILNWPGKPASPKLSFSVDKPLYLINPIGCEQHPCAVAGFVSDPPTLPYCQRDSMTLQAVPLSLHPIDTCRPEGMSVAQLSIAFSETWAAASESPVGARARMASRKSPADAWEILTSGSGFASEVRIRGTQNVACIGLFVLSDCIVAQSSICNARKHFIGLLN